MSLVALDLREISEVDLEGSGLDLGILGFRVSPEFTRFSLSIKRHLSCKLCRIRVLVYASESMSVTIRTSGLLTK